MVCVLVRGLDLCTLSGLAVQTEATRRSSELITKTLLWPASPEQLYDPHNDITGSGSEGGGRGGGWCTDKHAAPVSDATRWSLLLPDLKASRVTVRKWNTLFLATPAVGEFHDPRSLDNLMRAMAALWDLRRASWGGTGHSDYWSWSDVCSCIDEATTAASRSFISSQ